MFTLAIHPQPDGRKNVFRLNDEKGKVQFSSVDLGIVLDWLYDNAHRRFRVQTERRAYEITLDAWPF